MDKIRKRKTVNPCAVCYMHIQRCFCHLITKLNLKTKLILVVHHRELKRTTNTGRLAVQALINSEMLIRGQKDEPLELSSLLDDNYESYILYPAEDALDIESIKPKKPVQLIVSDGNWRQAGKLHRRHPELKHLPRIRINEKNLGEHHLRKEHFADGFSTIEAIAIALGSIEGEDAREKLMEVYRAKLHATLAGRGLNRPNNILKIIGREE